MKSRVLIITYNRYPAGDAGAVRDNVFAKLYKKAGFDVTVVGMGESTDFSLSECDGIPYISFRNKKGDKLSKLNNYFGYCSRLKAFLKSFGKCELMHIVEIPPNALFFIKSYAKKNNIKLVHDSVEWYSPEQFKSGCFDASYILKNLWNKYWVDKQFSVVAISSFLEKHFKNRGLKTTRIPVIIDTDSIAPLKQTVAEKTVFMYAGSPGKKDYLKDILAAFALLSPKALAKCELRLLGVTREQLVSLCGAKEADIARLDGMLCCLGRVSRDTVLSQLEVADFTLLLRSATQRYAKAGFPTKVVESLASGTPVIANLTSDLGDYLKTGYNAVITENATPEAMAKAIEKALELSFEKRQEMYQNSRKTAEDCFDYKLYINKIKEIL